MQKSGNNILLVFAGLAIGVGLGFLLLASCGLSGYLIGARVVNSGSHEDEQPKVGSVAPDFKLTTISGEPIRLSELRSQAVILNFWATWCGPCVEEMAIIQSYSEEYAQDLIVLGINADEPLRKVSSFVDQHGLSFPVLLDPDSRIQDLYKVRAFPTSYFIDTEGTIRAIHIGLLSESLLVGYLEQIGVGE